MRKQVVRAASEQAPYSAGYLVGSTFYSCGMTAVREDGSIPEDIAEQTRVCVERLRKILAEVGGTLSDVVKVNVFLTDMNDYAKMNEAYRELFPEPRPARSCVQVAGLTDPRKRIEMEWIAVLGGEEPDG